MRGGERDQGLGERDQGLGERDQGLGETRVRVRPERKKEMRARMNKREKWSFIWSQSSP